MIELLLPLLALSSPWWEGYDIRERFLCGAQGVLVVERNDAQASLISGSMRLTLFREQRDLPGLRYGNGEMRLILDGDELTLEQLPMRLSCLRTDNA